MAKFLQICASQNDLFALDEDGNVYQYDFNAKTWVELVASRSGNGHRPRAEAQETAVRWTLASQT
ncbi:MAG: hypothetical protein ACREM3_03755 [Candidatus Rokuibacteriota bacterium]